MTKTKLYTRVTEFIHLENDLLDFTDYQKWLDLWTKDGLYIVPVEVEKTDYANHLNYAYDDADMRRMRVARLGGGEAISVETSGGTIRFISRLRILCADDELIKVRCAMYLTENRRGEVRSFTANVDYQLVPKGKGFLIQQKVVNLINANDYLRSISYIL